MTIAVNTEGDATPLRTVLYVSGPMTGRDEFNYPAFHDATAALRIAGYDVISPAELDAEAGVDLTKPFDDAQRREALARDCLAVTQCDGIAVLPGWEQSSGARAELALGVAIPIPARDVTEWLALAEGAANG